MNTAYKCDFEKVDDERRLVWGWAYVVDDGGAPVVDHSGDFVDNLALPAFEDAVYEYVLKSRQADEMHERFDDVAVLVESVMVTPDKLDAMGLSGDRTGWWVGYRVTRDEVWEKVKNGTYGGLSIRGRGRREALAEDLNAA